nr:ribonuclease H-like domain-containing protein [Tanacetum cinerariifolium]
VISSLHHEFSMTDLGSLNYFLGISVTRDSTRIFLYQRKYAVEIIDAKAEYRGVAETCWLRNLLRELDTPLSSATLVYCDSVDAASQVQVLHAPSRYQFMDIFTKGLPYVLFEEFRSNLIVRCHPDPTAGEC